MKCKCGNDKFTAHQVLHVDVIVDGNNNFLENPNNNIEENVYHANDPFGPYRCTKCGEKYDELEEQE